MFPKKYNREQQLLSVLSDGRFHSGSELGEVIGITRSAIWKMIQKTQGRGILIQSVSGKGYRIPNGLTLLDEKLIYQKLSPITQQTINRIDCLECIESTNDLLLQQARPKQPQILACFAEQQTAGKGRRGREWVSPYANNIYHSLLWWFDKDPSELLGLSLAIAVGVARALQRFNIDKELQLKWPNDILWNDKKLGGILVELLAEPHQQCAVVIGIGINTRLTIQQSLNHPITSTEDILQQPTNRNELAALLLDELVIALYAYEQNGLTAFIEEWERRDAYKGKTVKLISPQQEISGIMKGITEKGELLLEDAQGNINAYLSGEVSLRQVEN